MLATHLGSWPFESLLGLEVVLASPGPSVSTKNKNKKNVCHSALEAPCPPIVSATVKCRSRGPASDPRSQRSCLSVGRKTLKTLSTGSLPFPCPISVCSVENLRVYTSFWSLMGFAGHCSVIQAVNTYGFTVRHFAVLSFATRSASGAPGFWHVDVKRRQRTSKVVFQPADVERVPLRPAGSFPETGVPSKYVSYGYLSPLFNLCCHGCV